MNLDLLKNFWVLIYCYAVGGGDVCKLRFFNLIRRPTCRFHLLVSARFHFLFSALSLLTVTFTEAQINQWMKRMFAAIIPADPEGFANQKSNLLWAVR